MADMIRIEDIIEKVQHNYPKADMSMLRRAYIFSGREHRDQFRKSGEPYLFHPLEVANVLADMGLDVVAVSVGLLHDIVEDTPTSLEAIKKLFGEDVTLIVDGVTKISKIPFTSKEHKQAENFRKLLLAMSDDVRVIMVKLADRLHNMRTLQYLPPEARQRISRETIDIYVPIANRLGMGKIKGELEDLAFSYLEPEKYQEVIGLIEKRRASGEKLLKEAEVKLRSILQEHNLSADFQSRIKRVYSIYSKLRRQKITFDEVYDFLALRVIADSIPDCYTILCYVHNHWKLVPGRFKDYIGMPRPNGYQSVHTTVMTETGIPFEIQIRTREMHRIAEEGIAAHWCYKEGKFTQDETDQRFTWLRHMLEWQKEVDDPHEFITNLQIDLYPEEVYTFTPKGDVLTLPKGATPLDFAYEIHTEVGHHCAQAKVNGRISTLKTTLRNGDIVEIITTKERKPSRDWLAFVKTTKARSKIRQWLKKQEKQESIELGRKIMEKEASRFKTSLKSIQNHPDLEKQLLAHGINKLEDLFSGIGFGRVSPRKFLEGLLQCQPEVEDAKTMVSGIKHMVRDVFRRSSSSFLVHGMSDILVSRAHCCNPLPGEEIVGYISLGRGVVVHAKKCPNLVRLLTNPEKQVDVTWAKRGKDDYYTITLQISTEDRKGMIADISNKITKMDVNIRDFRAKTTDSREAMLQVTMDVQDLDHLNKIFRMIKSIKNVRDVERVERSRSKSKSIPRP